MASTPKTTTTRRPSEADRIRAQVAKELARRAALPEAERKAITAATFAKYA